MMYHFVPIHNCCCYIYLSITNVMCRFNAKNVENTLIAQKLRHSMTVIDETTRTNPPTRRLPAAYGAPALRSLWCCTGFVLCPSACSRGRSKLEGSEAKRDTSQNMKGVVTAPPVEPQANKAGRVVGAYTTCPAQLLQVILTPKMVTCSCKSRAKLGHIKMQNSA